MIQERKDKWQEQTKKNWKTDMDLLLQMQNGIRENKKLGVKK